jgi:iron complex outermembrane receptor protein
LTFASRRQDDISPKAAIGYYGIADWNLKASVGRALRFPTVCELDQGAIIGNVVTNNDPNLKPERSITSELTAERVFDHGSARLTIFHERTHDALYSQTNVTVSPNVTNIQNVDLIRTNGLEFSSQVTDWPIKGVDLAGSVTRANSKILADANFPQAVGKQQPRVPDWRANLLATWHATSRLTATIGARYSGRQFATLDNSDPNAFTFTGFSSFFVVDTRVRYRFDDRWIGSLGIDNLNNKKYWAFHPYPQRTFLAELGYDL